MTLRRLVPRALASLALAQHRGARASAASLLTAEILAGNLLGAGVLAASVFAAGCQSSSQQPSAPPPAYPAYYPPGPQGQYPQQQYPQGQSPQPPYPPQQQYPAPAYPAATTPAAVPVVPLPALASDPINDLNLGWLRQQAQGILGELVAALPDASRARVQGIPLVVDDTVGEVNAFAACSEGRSLMAITDGLLEITAWLAMAAATDEVFGGSKTDEYIHFIATHLQSGKPIPRPAGMLAAGTQADGRKVQRQHVLFEEELAFVLGHELAHHHLGHLPCTGQPGPIPGANLLRSLSQNIPVFNQPNESAADVAGTSNVLDAGARRGSRWTEQGGLLTMRFFQGLEGGFNLLSAFGRSHPSPSIRVPVIQGSANYWRSSGGRGLWVPRIGG